MFRSRWAVAPLVALMLPAVASAHAVGLDVKLKDNAVRVEAYYDDDTPAADAKVTVETADKAVVAEGKTDDKGVWTCSAPAAGEYTVRVDAGDGHKAKAKITVPAAAGESSRFAGPVAGDDSASMPISDGPTRDEFTGPMKWVWAGVGLLVIAAGTLIARRLSRSRTAAVVALFAASPASAHYHMLLPDKPSAKAGEAVAFTYQFGHPFEHELADAAKPKKVA